VLVTPLLLSVITLLVQFGLWYHSANVAGAAAQEGARACRIDGGTEAIGEQAALRFLNETAGRLLSERSATCARDDTSARLEVRGRVVQVVPIAIVRLPELVQVSEGPVERFRAATEAGG